MDRVDAGARVAELEEQVRELTRTLAERDVEIAKLEGEVSTQEHVIGELHCNLESLRHRLHDARRTLTNGGLVTLVGGAFGAWALLRRYR